MSTHSTSVFVVQDDPATASLLDHQLRRVGFGVQTFRRAEDVEDAIKEVCPDLVIIDPLMPGSPGIELLRRWRHGVDTREMAIVVLSDIDGEKQRVDALDAGADDYVAKPFSIQELIARAHSTIRRSAGQLNRSDLRFVGDIALDVERKRVWRGHVEVNLTPLEFRLLALLFDNPGKTLSRQDIVKSLGGRAAAITPRSIDARVVRLRRALASEHGRVPIAAVTGVGYMLLADNQLIGRAGRFRRPVDA